MLSKHQVKKKKSGEKYQSQNPKESAVGPPKQELVLRSQRFMFWRRFSTMDTLLRYGVTRRSPNSYSQGKQRTQ